MEGVKGKETSQHGHARETHGYARERMGKKGIWTLSEGTAMARVERRCFSLPSTATARDGKGRGRASTGVRRRDCVLFSPSSLLLSGPGRARASGASAAAQMHNVYRTGPAPRRLALSGGVEAAVGRVRLICFFTSFPLSLSSRRTRAVSPPFTAPAESPAGCPTRPGRRCCPHPPNPRRASTAPPGRSAAGRRACGRGSDQSARARGSEVRRPRQS